MSKRVRIVIASAAFRIRVIELRKRYYISITILTHTAGVTRQTARRAVRHVEVQSVDVVQVQIQVHAPAALAAFVYTSNYWLVTTVIRLGKILRVRVQRDRAAARLWEHERVGVAEVQWRVLVVVCPARRRCP